MSRLTKKPNQIGFTIIEVVITIFIISVTLIIYDATSKTVVLNKWNRHKEVALRIADEQIQTLRTTSYASLPASGSFSHPLLSTIPNGAGTITLTDLNAKTKDIIVTVTWRNPNSGSNDQVQLETYVTQGGIGQ